MRQRKKDAYETLEVKTPAYTSNLVYLADVLNGKVKPENDLSSLSNNMIVVKILDAARESALTGRRVALK